MIVAANAYVGMAKRREDLYQWAIARGLLDKFEHVNNFAIQFGEDGLLAKMQAIHDEAKEMRVRAEAFGLQKIEEPWALNILIEIWSKAKIDFITRRISDKSWQIIESILVNFVFQTISAETSPSITCDVCVHYSQNCCTCDSSQWKGFTMRGWNTCASHRRIPASYALRI